MVSSPILSSKPVAVHTRSNSNSTDGAVIKNQNMPSSPTNAADVLKTMVANLGVEGTTAGSPPKERRNYSQSKEQKRRAYQRRILNKAKKAAAKATAEATNETGSTTPTTDNSEESLLSTSITPMTPAIIEIPTPSTEREDNSSDTSSETSSIADSEKEVTPSSSQEEVKAVEAGEKKAKKRNNRNKKKKQLSPSPTDSTSTSAIPTTTPVAEKESPQKRTPIKVENNATKKKASSPLRDIPTTNNSSNNNNNNSAVYHHSALRKLTCSGDSEICQETRVLPIQQHSIHHHIHSLSVGAPIIKPIRQPINPNGKDNGFSMEYRRSRMMAARLA